MSYINNMNPRRMIWFNQNAPKNKMDLWLSYNRHYEDTSEDETVDPQLVDDNPSQRKCDLILKAWDCGKWIPIVGFNTAAANKIDTVEGNTLYHPAIFTGENPNDLYDAGSLGSLLSNPNFVTELEWHDVFNSSNYDWGDIFGDTNWFGDLIWETIQGGSSTYHLPFATTERCGGILSATHPAASSAFKPIEVKFYPTVLGYYQNEQHRLCVSASDVIQLINNYYNDNPSGLSLNIPLANTLHIGGIKAAQDPNTADDCRNIPIVLAGPTVGSVWGLPFGSGTYPGDTDNETEYLYLPGWALLEWMKNPYFNQQNPQPFITGWKGVDTQLRENSDLIWVGLSGVTPENTGKFCTVQLNNTDPSGATIDWVDFPIQGNGFDTGIVNNKIYAYVYLLVCDNNIIVISDSITPYDNTSEWPLNTVPLWENTKYLINNGNLAVTSITIDNQNNMNIYNTSYIYLKTGAKCIFTFPESMNFIQSYTVNSSTGEHYTKKDGLCSIQLNDNQYYIIRLEADTIRMEVVDNSIFDEQI